MTRPDVAARIAAWEANAEQQEVLREARVAGMTAAVEHLLTHAPLPVDLAYVNRHFGLDGRDPEAASLSEAIVRMLAGKRLALAGDHSLRLRAVVTSPADGTDGGAE